jgi:murein DD-endopeptidase MepM/ murein hydrolase activator NlpD
MENVVAARRLRKSMLNKLDTPNIDLVNGISIGKKIRFRERTKNETEGFKISFKFKFIVKILLSISIIFSCLVCKLLYPQITENNGYVSVIKNEYLNDYSKEIVLDYIENKSNEVYFLFKYIIPESLANFISKNYVQFLKPKILNFELKNLFFNKNATQNITEDNVSVQSVENLSENINLAEENGVGGGEPIEETAKTEIKEDSSSTSIMQNDANEILAKNINIIKPVSGKVTSIYGAREQIFDNVNPYHTGIDIANVLNTNIVSATTGKVTKVEVNNKYYGNTIEIETNGVTFKYAHLNSFNIKDGDNVNQGDLIGKMGSTGMSTGSHLHFEIRINSRTVDPSMILSF